MSPRSPWPLAFACVLLIHLCFSAFDATPWVGITKVLIVPTLILWALAEGAPRIVVVALIFCTLGDLFLIWDNLFTAGMAAFAVGHVCFIRFFVSRGAFIRLKNTRWIAAAYITLAIPLVGYLWDGLPADIRPLIPVYTMLLVGTAATSLALDRIAGLGGGLFLASDAIIALGEADKWQPAPSGIWIMALYGLGLFFLSAGILAGERTTSTAVSVTPDPSG